MESIRKYCVYFHINPLKNQVFYVGMGSKKRAYFKYERNIHWHRTVEKYGLIVYIVHENLTLDEAYGLERFYIKKFGRRDLGLGNLVNLTDGGDSSYNVSQETRKKISEKLKGRFVNDKTRMAVAEANRNRIIKPESIEKSRLKNLGKRRPSHSEWLKNNHPKGMLGKNHSEESKNKMSLARKGIPKSEETKRRMREYHARIRMERNIMIF